MSENSIAGRKPHPYAEAIHAWADGAPIEYRCPGDLRWSTADGQINWYARAEFRAKQEVGYPQTSLTEKDFVIIWSKALDECVIPGFDRPQFVGYAVQECANAALKHAIERQQVIPMPEVQEVARNLNAEQHKKELQAVAEAVYLRCLNAVTRCSAAAAHELRKQTDVILGEVGK